MKSILTTILLFGLFACSDNSKSVNETTQDEIEFAEYYAKDYKLKISYPKSWDTTNLDKRMILTILEHKTSKQDTFKENIVLYKTQLPSRMTLDSVLKLATTALFKRYENANLIETKISKNTKLKDYASFTIILPQNGNQIVSSTYYFPTLNDFYILDIGYNKKDSAKYRPLFDKVVNSLTYE